MYKEEFNRKFYNLLHFDNIKFVILIH
jgi:hypothetical protein